MKKHLTALLACSLLASSLFSCVKSPSSPDTDFPQTTENSVVLPSAKITGAPGDGDTPSPSLLSSHSLTADVSKQEAELADLDTVFIGEAANFAVRLFQETRESGKNALISPLSVLTALAMLENGTAGNTRTQMESVLCNLPAETLNRYLAAYIRALPSGEHAKLALANSVWLRDDESLLTVRDEFLGICKNIYNAEVYAAAFDETTVKDINSWVDTHTDGMIREIIREIGDDNMLYLINTVLFDAEWQEKFTEDSVRDDVFTAADGTTQTVSMMNGTTYGYLSSEDAVGFTKAYANGYHFAALLPTGDFEHFVSSLTGEKLLSALSGVSHEEVILSMPKFAYDCSYQLVPVLEKLGITDVFSQKQSNLSALGSCPNGDNLYVDQVIHKTRIEVGEAGTKAAAVTAISVVKATGMERQPKRVVLDRPFVYAIVDDATGLPVFIGCYTGN